MKALILAAGFGTRLEQGFSNYMGDYRKQLQEWVENKPKGLVLIRGKPIVSYLYEQITDADIDKDQIFIQTNARYYEQYCHWAQSVGIPLSNVINNGVMRSEDRLESIWDLKFAFDKVVGYDDSLLILASDTLLFDDRENLFNIKSFVTKHAVDCISRLVVYRGEQSRLSRHGIVEVDDKGIIMGFQEKPAQPKTNIVNASIYLYTSQALHLIRDNYFLVAQCGNMLEYLYKNTPIQVEFASRRVDIGTIDDVLEENLGKTQ